MVKIVLPTNINIYLLITVYLFINYSILLMEIVLSLHCMSVKCHSNYMYMYSNITEKQK